MTRPVMLTTSHGDGAGVRVTPAELQAIRDELAALVIEAENLHRRANFHPLRDVREQAREDAEEADDKVLQYLSQVLTRGGVS